MSDSGCRNDTENGKVIELDEEQAEYFEEFVETASNGFNELEFDDEAEYIEWLIDNAYRTEAII